MNILVLLSLAGVAACSTSLIGADRARDVELQYTFVNDAGKEVRVEVEAERLGLSLRKQPDSELDVEKEVISDGEEASPVDAKAAARPRLASAATSVVRPRLPQAEAAPRTRLVQAAPRRQVETRFVQVGAVPAPQPQVETRFVQVPAPQPQVETRFVQVEAVPPPRREVETRFVHVPVSQPEVETRFVQVEAVPEPYEVETRFVQVEAVPAPRREVETRFVQVEAIPAPRREVETRFVQVEAVPAPRREVETRFVHVPVSQPEVETRLVQVEAIPAPRRELETRFIQESGFVHAGAAPLTRLLERDDFPFAAGLSARRPALRGRFSHSSAGDSAEK